MAAGVREQGPLGPNGGMGAMAFLKPAPAHGRTRRGPSNARGALGLRMGTRYLGQGIGRQKPGASPSLPQKSGKYRPPAGDNEFPGSNSPLLRLSQTT